MLMYNKHYVQTSAINLN